jgi:hypothetical protein
MTKRTTYPTPKSLSRLIRAALQTRGLKVKCELEEPDVMDRARVRELEVPELANTYKVELYEGSAPPMHVSVYFDVTGGFEVYSDEGNYTEQEARWTRAIEVALNRKYAS